ncbi:MAG TPA: hypothetical protein GX731_02670 [Clostridiales bacterium]|nr:hypothetical protein [Clostridiales bacterium]
MNNYFLIYDDCCFFEIVILSYFLKIKNQEVQYCSMNGSSVRSMEGFSVNVDLSVEELDTDNIKCFVIPGGDVKPINNDVIFSLLLDLKEKGSVIAAICAGVDILNKAGVLDGVHSTHSDDSDVSNDKKIITARANAYADFAIEVTKELELFDDEEDLQETIDFWKYHKRC